MPRPRAVVAATTFVIAATSLALATPAAAAPVPPKTPLFQASGAGTAVTLVGGVVTSGPTAPAAIKTRKTTSNATLSASGVNVPGIIVAGAVRTDASTSRDVDLGITTVTGHAKTAAVDVLGGVLHVDAVDTTASLSVRAKKVIPKATTRFTNLRIAGHATINGQIAPNTTIEIPGVAKIVLNQIGTVGGATDGMAVATGIVVTLLDQANLGSTVVVNPTAAQTSLVGLGYAPLTGLAIGAQVTVDSNASLNLGPFGAIGMPDVGTNKQTLSNTVASANLGAVGTLGTLTTTANGAVTDGGSRSTMHAHVAGVSLLGGLVSADALDANAEVSIRPGGTPVKSASVTFTGLTIAGVAVPLDAAPGLIIPLPGVGGVAIRATATTDNAAAAVGLTIILDNAGFGLPAGATIQVGFAYAGLLDT